MALVSVQSLSIEQRLQDISFDLQQGEILGVIGPNGSGKSTLLNALGSVEDFSGLIMIEQQHFTDITPKKRAKTIGLLPQSNTSAWSLKVYDVVALGRMPWGDDDPQPIQQAITWAGIDAISQRNIDELSGGERARVWLARVLAGQPQILLADEPIASLDLHYQLAVMNVLQNYAKQGNAVLMAIHDLSLAARYCDRLCLLDEGKIAALGSIDEVLTKALLSKVFNVEVDVNLNHVPPLIMPQ